MINVVEMMMGRGEISTEDQEVSIVQLRLGSRSREGGTTHLQSVFSPQVHFTTVMNKRSSLNY